MTNAAADLWGEPIPGPEEYIDVTFGAGGYLARRWGPSYQPRGGQITLSHAVDAAITSRTHLLSEAPCGIGKSLAYSVPASYHAATGGKTVVLVTANITLQEQLIKKDLPLLAEVVPWSFTYGLMKGRANYLCRAQYERLQLDDRQGEMFADEALAPANERDRIRLAKWATSEIARGGHGDNSSIGWKPSDKLWRDFSVAPEECRGQRCAFAGTCGALAAQREARKSQVVVTNYSVFFIHLLIWMERGMDVVLPPFDAVVFDECFPAGTMIGDVPIERLSVGDEVNSYDENTDRIVRRRVRQVFVRRAGRLLRLTIGDRTLVCTPGHPIFTARGWTSADELVSSDLVRTDGEAYRSRDAVRGVWQGGSGVGQRDVSSEETGASLLFAGS